MTLARAWLAVTALVALTRCGPGAPSCPDGGTTLTYANFGAAFINVYCVQCHGPARTEKGIALNTASLVRSHADVCTLAAGVGTSMPPAQSAAPTADERKDLAQWLSCGAP